MTAKYYKIRNCFKETFESVLSVVSGGMVVKKGFSFVEMAIVLVIIGLIMGMALKGKELITSSEIRKELNKFRKYEAAFTGTLMKTNKLPKNLPDDATNIALFRDWSDNISDLFIEQNYLKKEDKFMRYDTPDTVVFYPDLSVNTGGGYSKPSIVLGENFSVYLTNPSDMFICLLENMIDDKNVNLSSGRYIGTGSVNNFEEQIYSDCFRLGDSRRNDYAYMFFKH
jgi:prepilin-type N-terminal cleavage/methylation domain-containing protein